MPPGQIKLSANLADRVILIAFLPPKSSLQNSLRANRPNELMILSIGVSGGFPCPDFGFWLSLLLAAFS